MRIYHTRNTHNRIRVGGAIFGTPGLAYRNRLSNSKALKNNVKAQRGLRETLTDAIANKFDQYGNSILVEEDTPQAKFNNQVKNLSKNIQESSTLSPITENKYIGPSAKQGLQNVGKQFEDTASNVFAAVTEPKKLAKMVVDKGISKVPDYIKWVDAMRQGNIMDSIGYFPLIRQNPIYNFLFSNIARPFVKGTFSSKKLGDAAIDSAVNSGKKLADFIKENNIKQVKPEVKDNKADNKAVNQKQTSPIVDDMDLD